MCSFTNKHVMNLTSKEADYCSRTVIILPPKMRLPVRHSWHGKNGPIAFPEKSNWVATATQLGGLSYPTG